MIITAVRPEQPLLVRIEAGDRDALLELYDRYGWLVYGRARRITDEPVAAELITAGIFARVWHSPAEFPTDGLARSLTALAERRSTRWVYEA
jgi:DNA-directed RNA polymerase specialized sigma24 family protein